MSKRHRRRGQLFDDAVELPVRRVFVDESGFTGPDLLSPTQPWVAYGAVMLEAAAAADIVSNAVTKNRNLAQAGELKATNLLKTPNGRRLVATILARIRPNLRWVVHHKRYALAGNFVEYVFEPSLSSIWGNLWQHDFNRFVANKFHEGLVAADPRGTELERSFRVFMNGRDDGTFWQLLERAAANDAMSHTFRRIAWVALHFREAANAEVTAFAGREYGKWLLDLSWTSLYGLCVALPSRRAIVLDVMCDDSKPLRAMADTLDNVGVIGSKRRQLAKLTFANSRAEPGVQLADIVAGAALHVWQDREDADVLRPLLLDGLIPFAVLPGHASRYDRFNDDLVHLLASYALNGLDPAARLVDFLTRRLPAMAQAMSKGQQGLLLRRIDIAALNEEET